MSWITEEQHEYLIPHLPPAVMLIASEWDFKCYLSRVLTLQTQLHQDCVGLIDRADKQPHNCHLIQ